jgi:maleylpyruvate isomerase
MTADLAPISALSQLPQLLTQPWLAAQGRTVPASETVWLRSREVWLHAVDLDSDARFDQIPTDVLRRLIGDIHRAWTSRQDAPVPHLVCTDDDEEWGEPGSAKATVEGSMAALAGWATGRVPEATRSLPLSWRGGQGGPAPRWI